MKTIITAITITLLATFSFSQNTVNCSAFEAWTGYMNVFELPANGGGYQFGSSWGVPALKSTIDSTSGTVTLQPNFNTYADNPTDPYWVNQTTMEGNKDMEANTFVEPGASFNDNDLTFHGEVISNDLDDTQYSAKAFIKALDPNNNYADVFNGMRTVDLPASGEFTISATAAELPAGLIIQFGFTIRGRNGNPAEEAQLGSIEIGPYFDEIDVEFDAADNWVAFMNVFDLPSNGGAYQFGSFWGLADTKSTLTDDAISNTLELQPNFNTYAENPTDPFWVDQATGAGNKLMEAATFVEPGPTFNGSSLTFSGDIYAYTMDAGYEVEVFIKALDSTNGYSDALNGAYVMDLPTSGSFEVSVSGAELPVGLIIQYGFTVRGANANPLHEDSLGSAIIGTSSLKVNKTAKTELSVFPNPATNELMVSTATAFDAYEVVSTTGQVVMTGSENKIDISTLPEGLYILKVNSDQGVSSTKFIKQ